MKSMPMKMEKIERNCFSGQIIVRKTVNAIIFTDISCDFLTI